MVDSPKVRDIGAKVVEYIASEGNARFVLPCIFAELNKLWSRMLCTASLSFFFEKERTSDCGDTLFSAKKGNQWSENIHETRAIHKRTTPLMKMEILSSMLDWSWFKSKKLLRHYKGALFPNTKGPKLRPTLLEKCCLKAWLQKGMLTTK